MDNSRSIRTLLILLTVALIAVGVILDGPLRVLRGVWTIQVHPARLINDFVEIAGYGSALVNAALVGLLGILVIHITGVGHSGITWAAVFTMTGFGLFGKTPLNILPIIFGVYLAARFAGKSLKEYLVIALFGTALGPVVSALAVELGFTGWIGIVVGAAGGMAVGMILPSVAVAMLNLHQGYNLYNMGLTCGFVALFVSAVVRGFGHQWAAQAQWYTGPQRGMQLLVPAISLILLILGFIRGKKAAFNELGRILKIPGRLPSDFVGLASLPGSLLNAGFIGIAGSLYLLLIGAPFNGPVLGGLFTVMGFAAFGTHLKNAWPVVAGVIAATVLTGNSLAAPGPVLAALFCTTLAPLAGEFGMTVGFIAGFVHLLMVLTTGAWQGAMNLYNNGFAGGLTASLIVAVIQWVRTNRPGR